MKRSLSVIEVRKQQVEDNRKFAALENIITSGGLTSATLLGPINVSAITVDTNGSYNSLVVSGNIQLQFTGTPVEGTWQKVRTTGWNGSYTLSVPNNAVIVNSSFTQGGAVASGTYDLWIAYVGGEYQINLVSVQVNAISAPTLSAYAISTANPDRITFSSSEIITGTTFSGFTLGSGKTITGLTINAGQTTGHYFTVNSAYVEGDGNDTIAYSGTGSDIQNAFGTALASFTATTVTNNVDSTAPQFVTASFEVGNVADNIVVLPLDEALDPTSVPAVGDFAILVDASPNVVTNVDIATSSIQVRLTLTTSVTAGQTVTAAYTKGANPLRDVALNETPSLTATAVTNNVAGYVFSNTHSIVIDQQEEGINITDTAFLRSSGGGVDLPFSIELAVKFTSIGTNHVCMQARDGGQYFIQVRQGPVNSPFMSIATDNSNYIGKIMTSTVSTATWYHIVGTYDGSKSASGINLYLNGSLETMSDISVGTYTGIPNQTGSIVCQVPITAASTSYLKGKLNLFRFYDKELSGAEVSTLYNAGTFPIDISGTASIFDSIINEMPFNNGATALVGTDGSEVGTPTYDTDLP